MTDEQAPSPIDTDTESTDESETPPVSDSSENESETPPVSDSSEESLTSDENAVAEAPDESKTPPVSDSSGESENESKRATVADSSSTYEQPSEEPEEHGYGEPFGEEAVPKGPKGKAIAALIFGILSLPLCVIPPIGLVFGIVALLLASSCLKRGQENKATAGRICGIVGTVFSTILLIAVLVVMGLYGDRILALLNDAQEEEVVTVERNNSDDEASMEEVYSDSEMAAYNAVVQRFEALKAGNPAVVAPIASIASEGFQKALGFTMEECGIDPAQYVQLMASDLTCDIDLIVTKDTEDTGLVTAKVTMRSVFAVLDNYNARIQTLDRTSATLGMSDEQVRARLGEEFLAAVTETTETVSDNATFNMVFLNGTWVIDQDSWDLEMDYLFGVYDEPAA